MSTAAMDEPALKVDDTAPTAGAGEFLTFRIGAEQYGIEILRVQEIRSYEAPMRIASAPADVIGVISLRGVIVPLVDLRIKLACEHVAYDDSTVVVVLNVGDQVVGAVVDSVIDVTYLTDAAIRPAPRLSARDTQCITGIGQHEERMFILIDVGALLSGAELAGLDAERVGDTDLA